MSTKYLSPLLDLEVELEPLFSNEYMLAFFKKFCQSIKSRMWKFKKKRNAKYEADDFLRVFFYSKITGRSIDSPSERLNRYLINKRKGRRRKYTNGRRKRDVPHQTDVNRYLRLIGLKKARNILQECLDNQLMEVLRLKLISKTVNVLIDFTKHDYYGKRDDKMITGTNRGRRTKKMRHYLGFSILSKGIHLYAGLEHVAKRRPKVTIIVGFLDHFLSLGFKLNFVMMDREFYNAELLDEIKGMKGNALNPAKEFKKIKQIIKEYLNGTGKRVRLYTFSSAPGSKFQFFQNIYLILGAKKGHALSEVKREFQKGKLSLKEATKLIYPIMTTQKPKGNSNSWASRTSKFYKKRWFIETRFSDLNRMGRRWKSKYDNTRYLDMLVRMLLYNSWKINKAFLKLSQKKGSKSQKWTLQDNQDALEELFLET